MSRRPASPFHRWLLAARVMMLAIRATALVTRLFTRELHRRAATGTTG